MKEFYYINSAGAKVGPLPFTEIASHPVTAQTMVWIPGMADWQRAADVPSVMAYVTPSAPQTPPMPQTPPQPGYSASSQPRYGQPQGQQTRVLSNKPQNYLWLGIVSTLLCCLPAGIVSIVYAVKVDNLWNQGYYDEAENASNNAKTWGFISVGLGVVCFIVGFIIGLAGA